jgi:hypothetical protein
MKVDKKKFDALLAKAIKTEPTPRDEVKARGKRKPKTPILGKQ